MVRHNSSSILNNQNLGHLIKPFNGYQEHEPARPTDRRIQTEKLRRHIKWQIIELFEDPLEHQQGLLGRHLISCGLKSTSFSSKMQGCRSEKPRIPEFFGIEKSRIRDFYFESREIPKFQISKNLIGIIVAPYTSCRNICFLQKDSTICS